MAAFIRTKDWSKTPLGPIDSWPQSLRTVVSLALASNSPISIAWGPEHIQIYNDAYRPICGAKHPEAMGQDFRECWKSAFPVIGEAFETALAGKSAYLRDMRILLDRFGFPEETWFTFSFSPIIDESGRVGGLFHPVTEASAQMLSERRTETLHALAQRAGKAKSAAQVYSLASEVLKEAVFDLPFFLVYRIDDDGVSARLVASNGLAAGGAACPELVDLESPDGDVWAIRRVARTGAAQPIHEVGTYLEGLEVGPYPEVPTSAFALPIMQGRPRAWGRGPVSDCRSATTS